MDQEADQEEEMMFNEESILENMAENKDGGWGKEYVEYAKEKLARDNETPDTIPFDETSEADNGI